MYKERRLYQFQKRAQRIGEKSDLSREDGGKSMMERKLADARWLLGLMILLAAFPLPLTAAAKSKVVLEVDAQAGGFGPPNVNPTTGKPVQVMEALAAEYERLHPDVSIKFVWVDRDGFLARVAGGVEPHIANAFLAVDEDFRKGWWVDLDPYLAKPNPYVSGNKRWEEIFDPAANRYLRSMDGHFYNVSIYAAVTGIYYNQDIFDLLGAKTPRTWDEMLRLHQKARGGGYTPMAVYKEHIIGWVEQVLITMLYDDVKKSIDSNGDGKLQPAEAAQAIKSGFFGPGDPRYREVWRLIKEWSQYWTSEPFSVWFHTDQVYGNFFKGKTAMMLDNQQLAYYLATNKDVGFKWGVMPFPSITKATSPFGTGKPAPTIGGAVAQLGITKRAVRENVADVAVDFLMFITAPQNSGRLISEVPRWVPNVRGVEVPPHLMALRTLVPGLAIELLGQPYRLLTQRYQQTLDQLAVDFIYGQDLFLDAFLEQAGQAGRVAIKEMGY